MENSNRVIKDYIADILEQVSSLMEKWEPYEKTRESLWEMLEDSSRHSGTPEEKQTLLMDYEMSLILASYLMGMHESRVTDCYIKNPEKILEILDDFSPLAEQKQILLLALLSLKDTDRELINALFFDGASTREYAQRMGVSQRAVIKRRDRILRDLKKFFENSSK